MKNASDSYSDDSEVLDDDQRPINTHNFNCQNKDDCGNNYSARTTCAGAVCHHRRGCDGEGGGGPPGDLDSSKQSKQGVFVVVVVAVAVVVVFLLLTTR